MGSQNDLRLGLPAQAQRALLSGHTPTQRKPGTHLSEVAERRRREPAGGRADNRRIWVTRIPRFIPRFRPTPPDQPEIARPRSLQFRAIPTLIDAADGPDPSHSPLRPRRGLLPARHQGHRPATRRGPAYTARLARRMELPHRTRPSARVVRARSLAQEGSQQEIDLEILRKAAAHLRGGDEPVTGFRFVDDHHSEDGHSLAACQHLANTTWGADDRRTRSASVGRSERGLLHE
jgi:hypothetical protein